MEWSSLRRSPALSVPDRLAVDLERLILEGELKPGDRLPTEQELGELFGVSRVSIRQALRELEARGLIDRKPGRGTTVRSTAARSGQAGSAISALLHPANGTVELARIMELRAIIEPPIAALAAQRLTLRDTEQLRALVEEMEQETDLERYAELDRVFHQAISQYTHNPLLAQLTELIATEIAPSRRHSVQSPERRLASSQAHRKIFEALARNDAEQAEAEARAHVETVLREALKAASSAETPQIKEQA
ncbi:FadR/GntR family transcriptional regulator [Arthrobacter mobilis]|uniref:FadR family transcriptional regulator n=1 Tax=Arthrobacter mobilis TaxID=2724944 RepID=A0A7X6HCI8_9MICC|nr:FadR/GntR family transcriptional regulator [Arthrobacter mobilis]NKX54481.1 FadR family transcriptional regulator [Arthrobacter mobilis]